MLFQYTIRGFPDIAAHSLGRPSRARSRDGHAAQSQGHGDPTKSLCQHWRALTVDKECRHCSEEARGQQPETESRGQAGGEKRVTKPSEQHTEHANRRRKAALIPVSYTHLTLTTNREM